MEFAKLTDREEEIGKAVIEAALRVHKELGPGLLEKVYEVCLSHELRKVGCSVDRQVQVPIKYDGITFDEGFRLDLLIEGKVIIEIKAVDEINPVWQARF